jgi:hypothetical protein
MRPFAVRGDHRDDLGNIMHPPPKPKETTLEKPNLCNLCTKSSSSKRVRHGSPRAAGDTAIKGSRPFSFTVEAGDLRFC